MADESPVIQPLVRLFAAHANAEEAVSMKRYMRDQFDFLGIKTPLRRVLLREYLADRRPDIRDSLRPAVRSLWARPEREYQYAAVDLLDRFAGVLSPDDLPLLESLVTEKSWWDTVDALAARIIGAILLNCPATIHPNVSRWRTSDNLWIRRTAILFQLKFRDRTDERLLFEIIRENADSSEFFIQKAIGWALREYSKTEAESVRTFVRTERLAALSQREALKWLVSRSRW